MRGRSARIAWVLLGLGLLAVRPAAGQAVEPPGPWVLDLRGTTVSLPNDAAFLPGLPSRTVVPGRGFGLDAGARRILGRLGPARLGVGADFTWARGTTPETATSARVLETFVRVAPDLSFNFGTRRGWSYLSLGAGTARVTGRVVKAGTETTLEPTGSLVEIHGGAGARWFTSEHMAVGFDLRLHQLLAGSHTPASARFAASVGVSLR